MKKINTVVCDCGYCVDLWMNVNMCQCGARYNQNGELMFDDGDSWKDQVTTFINELDYDPDDWENNNVQFPRLISAIIETHELDLEVIAGVLDIPVDSVSELFLRAQEVWEHISGLEGEEEGEY